MQAKSTAQPHGFHGASLSFYENGLSDVMANVDRLYKEKDILRNVRSVIRDPLQVSHHEYQVHGLPNHGNNRKTRKAIALFGYVVATAVYSGDVAGGLGDCENSVIAKAGPLLRSLQGLSCVPSKAPALSSIHP